MGDDSPSSCNSFVIFLFFLKTNQSQNNNENQTINMNKDFIMKNISDSYEKKNYEKTIKKNLSNSIANELILKLTSIK